ncbi:MAG: hypothetical protein KGN33_09520 [Paracoccaceae bacterium]|nr:hypothetical protein [Paracoccaceae bacterium]
MAAATMWREDRFSARYRDMAALLLLLDPPKSTRPKATFDALFVMGMAVGQQLFSHPTEGPESKRNPGSSAAMKFMGEVVELAPHQHREPSTPPAIWKKRREKLMAVGFREYEVLEFFDLTFPAKQMG